MAPLYSDAVRGSHDDPANINGKGKDDQARPQIGDPILHNNTSITIDDDDEDSNNGDDDNNSDDDGDDYDDNAWPHDVQPASPVPRKKTTKAARTKTKPMATKRPRPKKRARSRRAHDASTDPHTPTNVIWPGDIDEGAAYFTGCGPPTGCKKKFLARRAVWQGPVLQVRRDSRGGGHMGFSGNAGGSRHRLGRERLRREMDEEDDRAYNFVDTTMSFVPPLLKLPPFRMDEAVRGRLRKRKADDEGSRQTDRIKVRKLGDTASA